MLTFLPLEQIDEMDHWEGSQLNTAKEILAFELTKMIHGQEEAEKAQQAARQMFQSGNAENMPKKELTAEDFTDQAIDIISMLQKSGLVPSRAEGRRAVEQGGVSVNGDKVTDIKATYSISDFQGNGIVLKRGKKNFIKLTVKN